ncbi:hypothetical protein DFA_04130 [Cavenderia fasciculata]|uniref:Uncharacterized protein n=1 Tax=Cavenderia fasciculata TaxID=261658 RepID=F4Q1D4_CACFS|nr:uncharacterized protein DFA_04130 [Cavenderia fasciculata]EGG18635.1 hypothetical protein DFA_04130 [Cavenderia fasciculata]|eukprot:XP_004366539.1 hypothetical protein DFA_04130 [Cavenderia fasciculata]
MNLTIKCKVCGSEESKSIDEFRLHGINHCIPSIARYFGVQFYDLSQPQQLQDERDSNQLQDNQQEDISK